MAANAAVRSGRGAATPVTGSISISGTTACAAAVQRVRKALAITEPIVRFNFLDVIFSIPSTQHLRRRELPHRGDYAHSAATDQRVWKLSCVEIRNLFRRGVIHFHRCPVSESLCVFTVQFTMGRQL